MLTRLADKVYANAYLLMSLTALFWAGNFVIGRGVYEHIPPVAFAWARWAIATVILVPFALPHLRRDWPEIRRALPLLAFLGALGAGAFNTLSYTGLNYTTALNALVLQSSGPILIVLASFFLFRDPVTPRQGFGIALSLTGVLVMVARGDPAMLAGLEINRGDLLLFAALVLWGLYTAYLRLRPSIHWLSFTVVTFAFGVLVNTPFFIWEHFWIRQMRFDMETALAVAYVAIFPSIFAYIFYNRGVELIGANRAGVCLHLVPLFGAILAMALLGEKPGGYHLAGVALILAGVTLAARRA